MDAYTIETIRTQIAENADLRTRRAREEIKKLALYLDAPEALALIQELIRAFGESMELSTSTKGGYGLEKLLDAVAVMEEE